MSTISPRHLGKSLQRGASGCCPSCGAHSLFVGYLTLNRTCDECGLALHLYAPAAGPAFLTIAVLGFLVGPLVWGVAAVLSPDRWVLGVVGAIALPPVAVLLLRLNKGAMVGYLWAFGIGDPAQGTQGRGRHTVAPRSDHRS